MSKNAATMIETNGKTAQLVESAGLFQCLMDHEIKSTTATFQWSGPKITKLQWQEMLAFFRWTQKEFKSEAQVRLFVHPVHGWLIWAFPQTGNTSLTTHECHNDDTKTQRASIGEGFVAFGTIHHHCNIAAFQSGTDLADEKKVDGLHITIGNMEASEHSIHCRMYIKGSRFEPSMDAFWDIGPEMEATMKVVEDIGFVTDKLRDSLARKQMSQPAPEEAVFNEQWKSNYLVEKPKVYESTKTPDWTPSGPHYVGPQGAGTTRRYWSMEKMLDDMEQQAAVMGFDAKDFADAVIDLGDGQNSVLYQMIMDECADNFTKLEKLAETLMERDVRDAQKEREAGAGEDKTTKAASVNGAGLIDNDDLTDYYGHGAS